MPEALALVKRELGPDAVILGTRTLTPKGIGRLARRARVEITAAPPETVTPAPRLGPRPKGSAQVCSDELRPYYTKLVQNEVAEELAARLVRQAEAQARDTNKPPAECLRAALRAFIARAVPTGGAIQLRPGVTRKVALVGPCGGGKTTTLAKLAALFKLRHRKRVALLSLDVQRLAAHEQLRRYADIFGVAMFAAHSADAAGEALSKVGEVDLLLIDTPGIGLRDRARMVALQSMLERIDPDEVHLVLSACQSFNAQAKAARAFAPLHASRVVLTRMDDAVGFGVILTTLERLDCRLSYLTCGQSVPNDLEEACGRRIAQLVFSDELV